MSIERGIERVIYNGIESGPEIGHSDDGSVLPYAMVISELHMFLG